MIKKMFKNIMFKLIPTKPYRISILDPTPFSGSNSYLLYKYIKKLHISDKYEIKLFENNKKVNIKEKIRDLYFKASSKVIITTHSAIKYKKSQVIVQLWHGIPLKSMGLLDKVYCKQWINCDKKIFDNCDNIISTSTMYKTLLNSTIGQADYKYIECGYPRNDYLINVESKNNIVNLFGENFRNKKVVFFVPTFRLGYANRKEGNKNNIFGLENLDLLSFDNFLKENNIIMVTKLHPFEEQLFKKDIEKYNCENIMFLESELLIENQIDLYELLAYSHLLVTDYSSVYFDYLLTKKPILFINSDLQEYKESRGLLIEPYDFWTPGPKVSSQEKFEIELIRLLEDSKYYMKERNNMLNLFHKYEDGKSCERVWKFIVEKYLRGGE